MTHHLKQDFTTTLNEINKSMVLKKSIARVALPGQVYDILREQIFDRIFVSGERLNTVALACEMNVSATSVREIISRLTAEGLVKVSPFIGAKVAPMPSADHYRQPYELRFVLEPWAASEAANHKDPAAIIEMAQALHAIEAAALAKRYSRFKTFSDADKAFHHAILKARAMNLRLKLFRT